MIPGEYKLSEGRAFIYLVTCHIPSPWKSINMLLNADIMQPDGWESQTGGLLMPVSPI